MRERVGNSAELNFIAIARMEDAGLKNAAISNISEWSGKERDWGSNRSNGMISTESDSQNPVVLLWEVPLVPNGEDPKVNTTFNRAALHNTAHLAQHNANDTALEVVGSRCESHGSGVRRF